MPRSDARTRAIVTSCALAVLGAVVLIVGRASAQNEPIPGAGVSETLEAAKLGALASGNVLAGPGQVVVPAGTKADSEGILWQHDDGSLSAGRGARGRNVTLTAQGLGDGCVIRFILRNDGTTRGGIQTFEFVIRSHSSSALTAREIRKVTWEPTSDVESDCRFLWVLRDS